MFNSATHGTWNNSNVLHTTGFTAASTIGQVITRNQLGWSIDRNLSCKDDDFLLIRLKNPHNTPMFVYSENEDMYVSRDIIYLVAIGMENDPTLAPISRNTASGNLLINSMILLTFLTL
jgi:hypothetical protein